MSINQPSDLITHIIQSWSSNIGHNITIGLSGGVDSVVLLHALHQITSSQSLQLTAIHVNHGISDNASSWASFCQELCSSLGIPLIIKHCKLVRSGGESLENIARRARYQEFFACGSDVIALAHHQDDQIETTLSQLFRGSDLHNIAAMHAITTKNNKLFWRPLLDISRKQIEDYAKKYNLKYITDESNADTTYLRNFIRHKVMPLLSDWDNQIKTKLLNFNRQLQDTLAITDEVAATDLNTCLIKNNEIPNLKLNEFDIIDLDKFKRFSSLRQLNLIAWFIKTQNLPLPTNRQLTEFVQQATTSDYDKRPQLKLGPDAQILKYKTQIFVDTPGQAQGTLSRV